MHPVRYTTSYAEGLNGVRYFCPPDNFSVYFVRDAERKRTGEKYFSQIGLAAVMGCNHENNIFLFVNFVEETP